MSMDHSLTTIVIIILLLGATTTQTSGVHRTNNEHIKLETNQAYNPYWFQVGVWGATTAVMQIISESQ